MSLPEVASSEDQDGEVESVKDPVDADVDDNVIPPNDDGNIPVSLLGLDCSMDFFLISSVVSSGRLFEHCSQDDPALHHDASSQSRRSNSSFPVFNHRRDALLRHPFRPFRISFSG